MTDNIQKNRYVAFLDIMGFKERVARNSPEKLYKELTDFNKDITKILSPVKTEKFARINEDVSKEAVFDTTKSGNKLMMSQFSDSIVLFSTDDTTTSLKEMSNAVVNIMKSAILRQFPIPIKGAISKGYMTCDMSKQLFFGQALIDAYLLEENVNYYGIVGHHTVESDVRKMTNLYKDSAVFLKSGRIKHYELVWYKNDLEETIKGLNRIRLSVSDSPRKYVDNTQLIIDEYKKHI